MLFLQHYNFSVTYRKGSSLHLADALSRAPPKDKPATPSVPDTFHVAHLGPTSPTLTNTTCEQLCKATTPCTALQLLQYYISHSWPPTKEHLPIDSRLSGTSMKNSALLMVSFSSLPVPSFLPLSDQAC